MGDGNNMHVAGSMAYSFTETILAFLPRMRQRAREHCVTAAEADDIVEHALARAIAGVEGFSGNSYVEPWLLTHLETEIAARCYAAQH